MKTCKVLHVFLISALLVFSLDADGYECTVETRVRQNTAYEASVVGELRITCPIVFCNKSPPAVTWFKLDKSYVPVNVSDRVKVEWTTTNQQEGVSYLVFHDVLRSDEGTYQCRSGGAVSHYINFTVNGEIRHDASAERPTGTAASVGASSHLLYRVFGVVAFLLIVTFMCVQSKPRCEAGSCMKTSGPQTAANVYDNDLQPAKICCLV